MSLTEEQQEIVDKSISLYMSDKKESYIKVNAIAGAGKSHTLIDIIKTIYNDPRTDRTKFKSRYFAYSKKLAVESLEKFDQKITECSTIHSMAYRATVSPLKLKLKHGNMYSNELINPTKEEKENFKHLTKKGLSKAGKEAILYHLGKYYSSRFYKISDYISSLDYDERDNELEELMVYYFTKMAKGEHLCTHAFYQKLFHILLQNNIANKEKYDVLLYDECGDANEVSLEIFKLLDSKLKVMVGDNLQNIFGFNDTVNGFETMKDFGETLSLSKSFRVSEAIAKQVELFGRKYADKNMIFKGIKHQKTEDNSFAYISRTNSALIGKMIDLDNAKKQYNLTRSADDMFKVMIGLLSIKESNQEITTQELKHIQKTVNDFYDEESIQREFKNSLFSYIMNEHSDDIGIKSACTVISIHKPIKIWETYYNAKNHAVGKQDHYYTLTTCHSSKGMEYDTVYIMDDFNDKLTKVLEEAEYFNDKINQKLDEDKKLDIIETFTSEQNQEIMLYYVGISRAKYRLLNAKHLECKDITEDSSINLRGTFED